MGYVYSHQFKSLGGQDHYYAMPEMPAGSMNGPIAEVSVRRSREGNLIRPNDPDVDLLGNRLEPDPDRTLGVDILKMTYGEDSPQVQEQRERPQMFFHQPEHISGVARNPTVSPAALGTLLGVAMNKHPNAKVDSTLTEDGSRLAKRGVASGAIEASDANPKMTPNVDWQPMTIMGRDEEGGHVWKTTPLSSEDVEAGRQTMRNLLRGNKTQTPKPMGPQFTQPELPGLGDL
jgi:hypothetical protein